MSMKGEIGAAIFGTLVFMVLTPADVVGALLIGLLWGASLYRWIAPRCLR